MTVAVAVRLRLLMAPLIAPVVVVEPRACVTVPSGTSLNHWRSSSRRIWVRSPRESAQGCVSVLPLFPPHDRALVLC
jgi:hypothetical protein